MFKNEKLYISQIKSIIYTSSQTEQKTPFRRSHVFGFSASNYGKIANCLFSGNTNGLYNNVFSQYNPKGSFNSCYCFDDCGGTVIKEINTASRKDLDTVCYKLNCAIENSAEISSIQAQELCRWKTINNKLRLIKKQFPSQYGDSLQDGSKEHPYIINSADDFVKFTININNKNNYAEKYILQTSDIDLTGRTDYFGANGAGYPYTFAGIYNGAGHTINVDLDTTGQQVNNTVFPYIEGTVMNVGVTGCVSGGGRYTAGFARSVRYDACVVNCFSDVSVSSRTETGKVYELCYALSGSAQITCGESTYEFNTGSVLFIPKELNTTDYSVQFNTPVDSISIFFDTDYPISTDIFIAKPNSEKNIDVLFDKIYRTWISRKSNYYLYSMSMLYEIIAGLSKPAGIYLQKDKYVKIDAGINYLISHCFDKNIDYNEPSKICGISYTYFKQLFIQKFQKPPMAYMTELKMERALELLHTGSVSITEIAELCGYENIYYFSKVFKKYYGVSPKYYTSI